MVYLFAFPKQSHSTLVFTPEKFFIYVYLNDFTENVYQRNITA